MLRQWPSGQGSEVITTRFRGHQDEVAAAVAIRTRFRGHKDEVAAAEAIRMRFRGHQDEVAVAVYYLILYNYAALTN